MVGTNPDGIQHTYLDTLLTKTFWRKHLSSSGSFVAPLLASWDGKDNVEFSNDTKHKEKALIKVDDGYLGLGDKILNDF